MKHVRSKTFKSSVVFIDRCKAVFMVLFEFCMVLCAWGHTCLRDAA